MPPQAFPRQPRGGNVAAGYFDWTGFKPAEMGDEIVRLPR